MGCLAILLAVFGVAVIPVAAVYGVVFVGARAVGGPILGWMVDAFGSRTALVAVGVGTAAFSLLGSVAVSRSRQGGAASPVAPGSGA